MLHRKGVAYLLLFSSCYSLLVLLLLLLFPSHKISLLSGHRPRVQASKLVVDSSDGTGSFDRCKGRRIYMHELPRELNGGLLEKCNNSLVSWLDFCRHLGNHGMGEVIDSNGWYGTDAYMLEVIFHSRILSYSCLTKDSAQADAFFVPYYAGLDALQYLYNASDEKRRHGIELVRWLESRAGDVWKKWKGKDHFMVMGRTSWDFAVSSGWGTGIQGLAHVANMTTLYIERNPWVENQFAVPYPTSFHPSGAAQLSRWIQRVKTSHRKYLFSFAGGIRATMQDTIRVRSNLLRQCQQTGLCVHVDCGRFKCSHNPRPSVEQFLQSVFCLQPRGDTPTRRSTFDAIISGCIPVFFHHDSAYSQYVWHLPADPTSYSVFIPEKSVKENGGVEVATVLSSYSQEEIDKMRSTIISLIPRLIYRIPSSSSQGNQDDEDAFDITLNKLLQRIAMLKEHQPVSRN